MSAHHRDEPRFEHTHPGLPIGTLCHTEWDGVIRSYLFVGWRTNTAGRFAVFSLVHEGEWAFSGWGQAIGLYYYAVNTPTILRKFPDLPEEFPL